MVHLLLAGISLDASELGATDLLNSRMAYFSVSRGRYDAQIYTSNASMLGQELGRDVSHSPAIQQSCVSLRSELDDEVTCGAVKGQDERPFGVPLTARQVTTGSIQRGTELA